jgi:hypothetical protein
MNTTSPHEILQVNCMNFDAYIITKCDPWQRDCILMLNVCSLFESPKLAWNFSRNTSKLLNKGDWCSNKGANQARVMLNNKVLMNRTWVRPIGYQWKWSWMTKHTWLRKPQNFERVPSNLLTRLICGSFSWGCVAKMHSKEVKAWLVYKWAIDSRNVWFSYLRFLKIARTSSMDVNMMNIVKYDTSKRWVIHNFNQQEVGNPQLFENISFKEDTSKKPPFLRLCFQLLFNYKPSWKLHM